MTNELTKFKENSATVYRDVQTYNQYFKMAECLARSEMIPQSYRNKPESVLLAIDIARQVQASPLFIMQNMFVINGKSSWSAQYSASIIKANFKNVRVELSGEGDERGCRIIATDKNDNLCEGTRITINMAKQEGWFNKTGSKWRTMPDQMLIYRAYSFFARVHCPEKLLGIHDEYEAYDTEVLKETAINPFEVSQMPEVEEVIDVTPQPSGELVCEKCGTNVSEKVKQYSLDKFKKILCVKCQRGLL